MMLCKEAVGSKFAQKRWKLRRDLEEVPLRLARLQAVQGSADGQVQGGGWLFVTGFECIRQEKRQRIGRAMVRSEHRQRPTPSFLAQLARKEAGPRHSPLSWIKPRQRFPGCTWETWTRSEDDQEFRSVGTAAADAFCVPGCGSRLPPPLFCRRDCTCAGAAYLRF